MNVCNLKDMLALPFDMAKFHQNMTKLAYAGSSDGAKASGTYAA